MPGKRRPLVVLGRSTTLGNPAVQLCKGSSVSRRGWNRSHGTRKEEQLAGGKGGTRQIPREQLSSGVRPAPGCHGDLGPGRPADRERRTLAGPEPRVHRRRVRPRATVRDPERPGGALCFREPKRAREVATPVPNRAGGRGGIGTKLPPPSRRPRAPVGTVQIPGCGAPSAAAAASPSPKPRETSGLSGKGRPWGHRRGSWGALPPNRPREWSLGRRVPNLLPTPLPF